MGIKHWGWVRHRTISIYESSNVLRWRTHGITRGRSSHPSFLEDGKHSMVEYKELPLPELKWSLPHMDTNTHKHMSYTSKFSKNTFSQKRSHGIKSHTFWCHLLRFSGHLKKSFFFFSKTTPAFTKAVMFSFFENYNGIDSTSLVDNTSDSSSAICVTIREYSSTSFYCHNT